MKPISYTSQEECLSSMKNKKQTNPRYKNFKQDIFTAGDVEQFFDNLDATPFDNNIAKELIETLDAKTDDNERRKDFWKMNLNLWEKYHDVNILQVKETFFYMFFKFKKGVYVKIQNNKVCVFLPFSRANYVNEWHENITFDKTKYKSMSEFIQTIYKMEGRKFNDYNINIYQNSWYGNNGLVRYEYPIHENDTNLHVLKDMLDELCIRRRVPDVEFFINKRDFPLIKRNGTEPYDNFWDTDVKELVSHSYEKYIPIFSMSSSDEFADILLPTVEDWARVKNHENIWFPWWCKNFVFKFETPWDKKINKAIFRGSSTGIGTTIRDNMRLKACFLSNKFPELLDAGITKWNLRPRKKLGKKYLETINIYTLPFGLKKQMSPDEQSKFKYILHIDGHVNAYRLSLELGMGSVILKVNSKYNLWFSSLLKEYVHYVPILDDLSDLVSQIKWCQENDAKCQEIARNAKKFYDEYLNKESILDYLQVLLCKVKKHVGGYNYNFKSLSTYILEKETLILKNVKHNEEPIFNWEKCMHSMFPIRVKEHKTLYQFNFGTKTCILKTKDIRVKNPDTIHEAFVGITSINFLTSKIPNFTYTFDLTKSYQVITMNIDGISLFDYIQNSTFVFEEYLNFILQICLALQVGQNECGLIHYDVTPWNIILQSKEKDTEYEYQIDYNKVICIKTRCVPVIIDYGKAHVVYNNEHYGIIDCFKHSTFQDIYTLLVTSLTQIIKYQKLSTTTTEDVVTLSKFIFDVKNKNELKKILHHAHKFDDILNGNKSKNLKNKTPLDLFNYIRTHFKTNFPIRFQEHTFQEKHFLDMKYTEEIHEICKDETRLFFLRNILNQMIINIDSCVLTNRFDQYMFINMKVQEVKFLKTIININNLKCTIQQAQELENLLSKIHSQLETLYTNIPTIRDMFPKLVVDECEKFVLQKSIDIEESLLYQPIEILKLLQTEKLSVFKIDINKIRQELSMLLSNNNQFALHPNDKNEIQGIFKVILSTNPLDVLTKASSLNTLSNACKSIYEYNIMNKNCDEEVTKIYSEILCMIDK
jgi:hypothetical protein